MKRTASEIYWSLFEKLLYESMCGNCERSHYCHNSCENCDEYENVYEQGGIKISENCVHIGNSYLFKDCKDKCKVLHWLFQENPQMLEHRSAKSYLHEWQAHNILYKKNFEKERTGSVDFELKQKWWLKIAYWFIAKFGKE